MIKVDLHVHSKYSKKPTEWFLKRIGAAESYTDIDYLYNSLKSRGMDLVTITDHNTIKGCLKLKEKYPNDTFISVESTAHFPEDNCKVHILIYDIDEKIFSEIEKLRYNIYDLRDFLADKQIPHSVAHPLYSVNNKLTIDHLEKLILLFDIFEVCNGCRGDIYNKNIFDTLSKLTENDIARIYDKHKIEPRSKTPWIKGFTGGSDDHSGLLMGKTYTISETANNITEFIIDLKSLKTKATGYSSDFYTLAFNIYKIAYDYTHKNRVVNFAGGLIEEITKHLTDHKKPTFWEKIKLKRFKKKSNLHRLLSDFIFQLKEIPHNDMDKRLNLFYDIITKISDYFLKSFFNEIKDKKSISLDNLYRSIASTSLGIFITIPFYSSFKHMFRDRYLIDDFKSKFEINPSCRIKRIAWFTDTINDLNGVSVTLKTIANISSQSGYPLKVFGSITEEEFTSEIPDNFINIDPIFKFKLPYYNKLTIKVPSALKMLKAVYEFSPDEIYVSTPGPIGLLGLILGKIMNIKTIGIYHTDFTHEIYEISEDENLSSTVEQFTNFFYNNFDEIKATSKSYIKSLTNRGLKEEKLTIFRRGIDTNLFKPLYKRTHDSSIKLLYAGRISKDKNVDFVILIFDKLKEIYPDLKIKLFIAGDGPYKDKLKNRCKDKDIFFTGKLKNTELVNYYNMSDIFLFPSKTDTFGMVVLEAQACGLPAIVSDRGGPKDIVQDKITGFVAKADDLEDWLNKISIIIHWKRNDNIKYEQLKYNAAEHVRKNYNWDQILEDIFFRYPKKALEYTV
ncbi:MAG: glycosyltransferase [Deferribacterales bacterium]